MKHIPASLCQLDFLSCFGCCGNGMADKREIAKAITQNTLEFHRSDVHVKVWGNRSKDLHPAGICRNLIYDKSSDSIYCPLHPEKNNGVDYRVDHHTCDILHVCKTAFFFDLWADDMKDSFLLFLKKKQDDGELDWYSYSKRMADDSLLEEFEGLDWSR